MALDEFGVDSIKDLAESEQTEFLQVVDTQPQFFDEDGNCYGPFWLGEADMHGRMCECEHQDHAMEDEEGHEGHKFREVPATQIIKTDYGNYASCDHCAKHHFAKYIKD